MRAGRAVTARGRGPNSAPAGYSWYPAGMDTNTPPTSGDWAVWDYTPEEWDQFDSQDWKRAQMAARKGYRNATIVGMSIVVVLLGVFYILSPNPPPMWLAFCVVIPTFILFVGVGTLLPKIEYDKALLRHNSRQQGPRAIRITSTAIYEGSGYIPLTGKGSYVLLTQFHLEHVYINHQDSPQQLIFLIHETGNRTNRVSEVRIPIPTGRDPQAERIVNNFSAYLDHARRFM